MPKDADFCKATNLSGFDVKSNVCQMAVVYWIFILQQVKFEKIDLPRDKTDTLSFLET